MSEENTAQGAPEEQEQENNQNQGNDEVQRLKAEAAQRRIENKKLQEQLESIQNAQKEAEQKKLEEKEEFKTLYEAEKAKAEEADKLRQTLEQYKERDKQELSALIEKVPEDMRDELNDESASLDFRLKLARKLSAVQKQPGPDGGPRVPGEQEQKTLEIQYQEALKNNNVALAIELKNKMYAKE